MPPTSSLAFFMPTLSLSGSLPLLSLSPNKLSPGKSPLQSQKSVSLGQSTTVNAGGETTRLTLANGSGGDGGLQRRNSLGDLKIPARISQAQVRFRRDLGMVREFISNVECGLCLHWFSRQFNASLIFQN